MTNIVELPEQLANQIAAGEVIERPASVVKELIENALDADSHQITIDIEESGLKKIKVSDNGSGIAPDDVALALKRHATSKIKSQSDLFRIRTLGFRGEAMPSIASVSRLTIETARPDDAYGTRLVANGGEIISQESQAIPVGTKVSVEDLFFNTPARLKYIKSLQAELSHIVDIVNRMSLAHPEVAFTLINDGREMIKTAGSGSLRQAIAGIYGVPTVKKMVEIHEEDLDFEVSGFISLPELTRANRKHITLLINGRYIKNFLLNRAILDGYGSKLMVGRFPIAVISIKIDPYLADVNVHPTKQEVRLSKEKTLMTLITKAISTVLKEQDLIPDALENLTKSTVRKKDHSIQTHFDLSAKKESYADFVQSELEKKSPTIVAEDASAIKDSYVLPTDDSRPHLDEELAAKESKSDHPEFDVSGNDGVKELVQQSDKLSDEPVSVFPELDFFGQMHGTYLFAQGKEGLYIIDQHAAQERIKYEYYREKIGDVDNSQQQLLMPLLFDFPTNDIITLRQKKSLLEQVDIHLEDYGDKQFILREHPIWLKEEEVEEAIYEMCDMLLLSGEVSIKKYRAELAIMMSCKRSIKANHHLDDDSARQLIRQLSQCKNPYNCPHGRPVLVHFTTTDMEKMFRRIQENHHSLRELGKY